MITKPKNQPIELINEKQETMFDTKLSKAADDYAKACLELDAWKKRKKVCGKDLIENMKRMKCTTLTMPNNKRIEYKFVDAKETLAIKDYKPSQRKRRQMGRA